MPFTDPMADGPTIQRASERALAGGVTMDDALNLIAEVRSHVATLSLRCNVTGARVIVRGTVMGTTPLPALRLHDGVAKIEECEGNGPVDAVFNCIKALVPHEAKLELYQVHAVTEGTDAQAEVSVRLAHEGRSMTARAADPDTLVASAKAYISALNKLDRFERRLQLTDVEEGASPKTVEKKAAS